MLPNGTRPCCPVYSNSLQVEAGLTPGASYRFRALKRDGSVVGTSAPQKSAARSLRGEKSICSPVHLQGLHEAWQGLVLLLRAVAELAMGAVPEGVQLPGLIHQ